MKKLLLILFTILPLVGLRAESIFVGAQDGEGNCAPVVERWTHFSPDYLINKGEVWHFQFKSYNIKQHDWDTYWLAITNDVERQGNGYNEYLMMLGKNDSWGSGTTTRQFTYTDIEGKTFQDEMDGASIDMTVLYDENNTFYVNSTITTASGRTFVHNAQTTGADGSQCRVFLTVENASIEITTAENVSRIVENRAHLNSTNKWTLVADADDLKAKAQSGDYYFAIAGTRDDVTLALNRNSGNNDSHLAYKKSANPIEDLSRLFYIETATIGADGNAAEEGDEVYNLRSVEQSNYLMQTNDNLWKYAIVYDNQPITVSWANLDITYMDNAVCKLSWRNYKNDNIYFGAWDDNILPNNIPSGDNDVSQLASNKSGKGVGAFAIYAIKRNEFLKQYIGESTEKDLTKFIINPSFESMGWESRGKWLGWSQIEGATTDLEYVSNTPDIDKEGTWYLQRWHTVGTYGVQQSLNHMPKGIYQLEVATAYDGSSDIARIFANSSEKSFNGLRQQSQVVTHITTDDTPLTIGAKIANAGDNRWFAIDNFHLMYVGKDMYVGEGTAVNPKYLQPGKPVTISYNDVLPTGRTLP